MITALLFITCLGEQFFSPMLRDMVAVLERVGVQCKFPEGQTCCGQPFFNSGFRSEARDLARKWLAVFAPTAGYIVAPSGSCVDMVRHHYPQLFSAGSAERDVAEAVAKRIFEFSQFLVHVLKLSDVGACFPHKATYHPSCHLLRGLGVREEPKQLLRAVRGLELVELPQEESCCGFGGTFSVTYPEVSRDMMEQKLRHIQLSGAEVVVVAEPGCLMNISGGLRKMSWPLRAMHLIEVLAATEAGHE